MRSFEPQADDSSRDVVRQAVAYALIVALDERSRQVVAPALEGMGFTVLAARNVADAFGLARRHPIRIVLLECTDPAMGMLDLVYRLRSDPVRSNAYIVGVTASEAPPSSVALALNAHIRRPITTADVAALLAAYRDRHGV